MYVTLETKVKSNFIKISSLIDKYAADGIIKTYKKHPKQKVGNIFESRLVFK